MKLVKIGDREYLEEFDTIDSESRMILCGKEYYSKHKSSYYEFEYDCLNFLGVDNFSVWRYFGTFQTFGNSQDYYVDALLEYLNQSGIHYESGRYIQKLPSWSSLVRCKIPIKIRVMSYGAGYEVCVCVTLREFIEKYFENKAIRKFMTEESEFYNDSDRRSIMKFLRKNTPVDAAAFLLKERANLKLLYNI